jgi:histone H3/H4
MTQGLGVPPVIGTPAILARPNPTGPANATGESDAALDDLLGLPSRSSNANNADDLLGLPAGDEVDVAQAAAATASSILPSSAAPATSQTDTSTTSSLLTKRKISDLISELDSNEKLEGAVEDLLLELADEFIESVTQMGCRLAKHRRGDKLEVRDVQLHLERNWNLRVPFPGAVPIAPPKTKVWAVGGTAGGGSGTGGAGGK